MSPSLTFNFDVGPRIPATGFLVKSCPQDCLSQRSCCAVCVAQAYFSTGELEAADSLPAMSSPNPMERCRLAGGRGGGRGAGGAQTAVGSGYWAVAVGCLPSTRLSLWFLCTFRTLTVGAAVSSLTAPNENASGGFSSQLPNQSQFISEHPPDRGSGGSPCARPAQLPL